MAGCDRSSKDAMADCAITKLPSAHATLASTENRSAASAFLLMLCDSDMGVDHHFKTERVAWWKEWREETRVAHPCVREARTEGGDRWAEEDRG